MRYAIALAFIFLSACGTKDSGSSDPKSAFSSWTAGTHSIDLSSGSTGSFTASISENGAAICSCSFVMSGGQSGGTLDISACSNAPACTAYEGSYTYQRSDTDLIICGPSSTTNCTDYN